MFIGILTDILIILIPVVGFIIGLKTGLFRSVFTHFRKLIAGIIALLLAKPVGHLFSRLFIADIVGNCAVSCAGVGGKTASSPEALLEQVPGIIRFFARIFSYDLDGAAQEAYNSGQGMSEHLIRTLSLPLANFISVILAFILILIIGLILLRFAGPIGKVISHIPVIGFFDRILGCLFCLLLYALISWGLAQLVVFLSGLDALRDSFLFRTFDIENTILLKYVYPFNPLRFLFSIP